MSKTLKLSKCFKFLGVVLLGAGFLIVGLPALAPGHQKTEAGLFTREREFLIKEKLAVVEKNSLLPITSISNSPYQKERKLWMLVTAYSSTPEETDNNPYITAAGTRVREGVVANNMLPFKTKIRIPEIFGDKIFVIEDRMHWKKGNYHIDVWFPNRWEALKFGVKKTYVEILDN